MFKQIQLFLFRRSWNVPNKSESKDGGHSTRNDYVHITDSELTTPDQVFNHRILTPNIITTITSLFLPYIIFRYQLFNCDALLFT